MIHGIWGEPLRVGDHFTLHGYRLKSFILLQSPSLMHTGSTVAHGERTIKHAKTDVRIGIRSKNQVREIRLLQVLRQWSRIRHL